VIDAKLKVSLLFASMSVECSYSAPAEQGDACAQVNLGGLYEFGEGVNKDDAEPMK
jgi:hypothetical protein